MIRPSLQCSLGPSVGAAEDFILAIFARALSFERKTIVLLDDLEFIFGETDIVPSRGTPDIQGDGFESQQIIARSRSTVFSMFDSLPACVNGDLFLICTAKTDISDRVGRFDKVYSLKNPTTDERHGLIVSYLASDRKQEDGSVSCLAGVNCLVEDSMGRPLAGLVTRFAQAHTVWQYNSYSKHHDYAEVKDKMKVLSTMKELFETGHPTSFRPGTLSDLISFQVFTASDLLNNTTHLLGEEMELAKKELEALIVYPLCQGTSLDDILHHETSARGKKPLSAGALISGPPGCGKTSLAFHCARDVAKQMPSIKLFDVSCTSLIQKELGSSERNIHLLFQTARAAAPCIVLMDGIEIVAAVRGNDDTTGGTMDRVLSTLLTHLDGLEECELLSTLPRSRGIAVIGITNDASWIDPALVRPGRLEKVIELGVIKKDTCCQIAKRELTYNSEDLVDPIESHLIARVGTATTGMTAAQVVSFCNQMKMKHHLASDLQPIPFKKAGFD